jgi:flagellar basal-body rod protein FlgF
VSSGIYVAAAGAVAQSNALDTTANNIANASTTGYHADRVTFKEALGRAKSADTAMVGAGGTKVDTEGGAVAQTGNPLDFALQGDGLFGVQTPNGARYTRAGNFQLDKDNHLVTADGLKVRGEGGAPITLPPGAQQITVDPSGAISADGAAVGKLELVRFAPANLKREGETLFAATGKPLATDLPTVTNGQLEGSNFNIVRGVVDLVKVSRTYESLMRVIQSYHDVESRAARDLGAGK